MAGVPFTLKTAENQTSTSTKTLLQIVAASNIGVLLNRIKVSFKGVSTTGEPILVELLKQTTAGTMSALTPNKCPPDADETLQVTAQENATAEPTASTLFHGQEAHPQFGCEWTWPIWKRFKIPGGTRLGVRVVTPAADVKCEIEVEGEE